MKPATAWIVTLALLCSAPAWSQGNSNRPAAGESMPPWTVLVLKLVSATHVEPTTGIMLGNPDLVLVPLEFARTGDEILVLDGGTDIVRHGRPAFLVHSMPGDQLAILRVQGLNRPAVTLSSTPESEINALKLVAFPPAEEIAQGAAPVRSQVKSLPAITTSHPTLDPYPNVTGALTDDCGNLVAFNLAVDVQSMQPASGTRLAWPDALKRAAELAGTPLREQSCEVNAQPDTDQPAEKVAPPAEIPDTERDEPEAVPEDSPPGTEEEAPPSAETKPVEEESQDTPGEVLDPAEDQVEETPAQEEQVPEVGPLANGSLEHETNQEHEAQASDPVLPRSLSRTTLFFAGLALFLILGWSAHYWRRKSVTGKTGAIKPNAAGQKPEPKTVRFEAERNAPATVFLLVKGQMSDGTAFDEKLPVSGQDWKANIGRQGAQLNLDSPSVSRLHSRIQVHQGRLTITDLDSTNGTRVNGVACLPGEVFFVQAGDKVQLGDVSISLQLVAGDD
jgi:hypothetical protein